MKKTPRISETEWEVMKVIWAQAPCAADQIIELLTKAALCAATVGAIAGMAAALFFRS